MTKNPCAMRRNRWCDLWATTLPRLARPKIFLKSEQVNDTSCLITDVQMPGLSGLDLQDHLIARGHRIPIIFMTGYPNDSVRARAMKAGAVCFLNKPFSEDHFIGCIEKALKAA
jgi:FixJ family two-component response regulator